jgi:hypothetical protein
MILYMFVLAWVIVLVAWINVKCFPIQASIFLGIENKYDKQIYEMKLKIDKIERKIENEKN